jgi:hypothetical protein
LGLLVSSSLWIKILPILTDRQQSRRPGTHNGHTANLALKLDAGIVASNRGGDLMPHNREMVQTFLDEQANDTVRVEDKVGTIRVLVTDHAVEALVADIADMSKDPYVSSAINCGVWGRMWMLACSNGLETVAVGF